MWRGGKVLLLRKGKWVPRRSLGTRDCFVMKFNHEKHGRHERNAGLAFLGGVVFLVGVICVGGLSGCRSPWTSRLTLPDQSTVVREQLTIHSDFDLPSHHRLLDELVAQRGDLNRRLGLPSSDEPIHVYLFENEDRFKGFMKLYHPDFPDRRAFFIETDTKLSVYAHWGNRVGEDLRHEITHGYLHSTVPNLPLWLDEGLAEFYEAHAGRAGIESEQSETACRADGTRALAAGSKTIGTTRSRQRHDAKRLCRGLGVDKLFTGNQAGIGGLA